MYIYIRHTERHRERHREKETQRKRHRERDTEKRSMWYYWESHLLCMGYVHMDIRTHPYTKTKQQQQQQQQQQQHPNTRNIPCSAGRWY